jgi:hypothetical protein
MTVRRNQLARVIGILVLAAGTFSSLAAPPAALKRLDVLRDFRPGTNLLGDDTLESAPFLPPAGWDELVVSWNGGTNLALTIEAQAGFTNGITSRWYSLGAWSAHGRRSSPRAFKDFDGEVDTDILRLSRPAEGVRVRFTLEGPRSSLKLVTLACVNRQVTAPNRPAERKYWGKVWDVPIRSQAEFPEGMDKWCSPTSTSMLMEFWARELRRPGWDFPVPTVAKAVFDPGWGGTGNWPFNTAFAGSQPGLLASVARFNDVIDLEQWVGIGFPVAASVSYAMLKGAGSPVRGDGHLVVVRGFTAEGDVAINDPGVRRTRIQRVILRADFDRAWAHSHRTVYLVWPECSITPVGECFP